MIDDSTSYLVSQRMRSSREGTEDTANSRIDEPDEDFIRKKRRRKSLVRVRHTRTHTHAPEGQGERC